MPKALFADKAAYRGKPYSGAEFGRSNHGTRYFERLEALLPFSPPCLFKPAGRMVSLPGEKNGFAPPLERSPPLAVVPAGRAGEPRFEKKPGMGGRYFRSHHTLRSPTGGRAVPDHFSETSSSSVRVAKSINRDVLRSVHPTIARSTRFKRFWATTLSPTNKHVLCQ